jgi:tetratricopeptide (TPR) repeat protein
VLIRSSGRLAVAVLAGLLLAPAQEKKEPAWKDQGEYDLVQNQIQKEADPKKKLQLLQQWEEKYPDSDFKNARNQVMLQTYQQAGDAAGMKKAAMKMTQDDPEGIFGLIGYQTLNLLTISMNDKSEAALADGEKASAGLLAIVDKVQKPEQVAADAWAKEVTNYRALAYKTKGWVETQRKNYTAAEAAFTESLKINPNQADVSSMLGTAILLQRNPDKQSAGLYHFVRAAALEGEGALPAQAQQQTKAYVTKTYTNFHGSEQGLAEIMERAKTEAFPPEGFKIESAAEIAMRDRDKLRTENPMLFRWLEIKDKLVQEGDAFFEGLKGSDAGGPIKGKLISATPENNPKELQISVQDGIQPDAVITMTAPLKGKADAGTEIEVYGSVVSYSKDPYTLTLEADPDEVKGWPTPSAPAKKTGGAKKTGKKK